MKIAFYLASKMGKRLKHFTTDGEYFIVESKLSHIAPVFPTPFATHIFVKYIV